MKFWGEMDVEKNVNAIIKAIIITKVQEFPMVHVQRHHLIIIPPYKMLLNFHWACLSFAQGHLAFLPSPVTALLFRAIDKQPTLISHNLCIIGNSIPALSLYHLGHFALWGSDLLLWDPVRRIGNKHSPCQNEACNKCSNLVFLEKWIQRWIWEITTKTI